MEVRAGRGEARINAGAALMSCVATLAQMLIIVAGVNLAWFKLFIIPSLVGIAILVVAGVWLLKRHKNTATTKPETDTRMFSLKEAAIIVATLTAIQAMVYGLEPTLGMQV